MLKLTGMCCNGIEAIEFMESLADIIPEDMRDDEFCGMYERALNRFRYEIAKSIPVPAKSMRRKYRNGTIDSCGKCGHGIDCSYKFCPNCGTAIKR